MNLLRRYPIEVRGGGIWNFAGRASFWVPGPPSRHIQDAPESSWRPPGYGRLTQYLLASQWTLSFRRARSLLLLASHHVHQCTACCPFNLTVDKYLLSERVSKISIGLDFPVVQRLTLCTPNAGALGSIPGQGTRKSCMWQLRLDTAELIHN